MKLLERANEENRKSAKRGARMGGHTRVPVPPGAIVRCTHCRRNRKPRGNETFSEYRVREWCDEPDCRDVAIERGYIALRKTVESMSNWDTPDIPCAAQWGFAAVGWRG